MYSPYLIELNLFVSIVILKLQQQWIFTNMSSLSINKLDIYMSNVMCKSIQKPPLENNSRKNILMWTLWKEI